MHMVCHDMAFDDFTLFLACERMENRSQVVSYLSVQSTGRLRNVTELFKGYLAARPPAAGNATHIVSRSLSSRAFGQCLVTTIPWAQSSYKSNNGVLYIILKPQIEEDRHLTTKLTRRRKRRERREERP